MPRYIYNGSNFYYKVCGEGYPVILIHGWGIDHNFMLGCMEPVFNNLSVKFKRYYVDLPGMGKSTPGNIVCTEDIVKLLVDFITQEIKADSVILVGNSFGGMICRALKGKIPKAISAMCLICPVAGLQSKKTQERHIFKKDEQFLKKLTEKQLTHFSFMNTILTKKTWEIYSKYIYPAVLENEGKYYLEHILDGSAPEYLDKPVQASDCPVLVMTGKQDEFVGYEDQFEWRTQYPRLSYIVLDGAGHNLPFDRPEIFNAIVTDWFRLFSESLGIC